MGTESLRTYNKIEPSSFTTKDRIIQIIMLSGLLLWIIVYAIQEIELDEYDDGLLIKAALFVAALFFIISLLLGARTYYKLKSVYSYNPSIGMIKAVKWLIFGLFVLMILIPRIYFPKFYRLFDVYLIALTYAGKHLIGKISKSPE